MENDLRDYACRENVLNESTSNENTVTSLKQYLSVPFFTNRNAHYSDLDSNYGDAGPLSPCIYVTSPASDDESKCLGDYVDDEDDEAMKEDGCIDDGVFTFDDDFECDDNGDSDNSGTPLNQHHDRRRHICSSSFFWDSKDPPTIPVEHTTNCTVHNPDADIHETSFTNLSHVISNVHAHDIDSRRHSLHDPGDGTKKSGGGRGGGGAEGGVQGSPTGSQSSENRLQMLCHKENPNINSVPESQNKCFLSVPNNAPFSPCNIFHYPMNHLDNKPPSNITANTIVSSSNNCNIYTNDNIILYPINDSSNNNDDDNRSFTVSDLPNTNMGTSKSSNLATLPQNDGFEMRRSASDIVGHILLSSGDNRKNETDKEVKTSFPFPSGNGFDSTIVQGVPADDSITAVTTSTPQSSSPTHQLAENPSAGIPPTPPRTSTCPQNLNRLHGPHGSPVPVRRKTSCSSARRKSPLRQVHSTGGEHICLLNRSTSGRTSSSGRVRHNSGDPEIQRRRCHSQRARSQSPSQMALLSVPGKKKPVSKRGDEKVSYSSRSMQDVSEAGTGNESDDSKANNVGPDGKLLRSSCLSLNGGSRRKRRGKSPHRVSFKVS